MNEYVNKRQPYSAEICFKSVRNECKKIAVWHQTRVVESLFYGLKTALKFNR